MRYWWVNHKQTYTAETQGGYIWSPKTEKNGVRSQFYDNLTLVSPNDLVFSYADTQIRAIGVASSIHREQPQPTEFGDIGANWAATGWLVSVEWEILNAPFSPKTHIDLIAPLLPSSYSPIQANGNGNQKCYLAEISESLANLILSLAGKQNDKIIDTLDGLHGFAKDQAEEHKIAQSNLETTVKEQLIKSRVGQGQFRENVRRIESKCRLTGVSNPAMLIASHIKPWRDCNNEERLDGHNGLLLSPHVDKLFDRGWISFEDDGKLLIKNVEAAEIMNSWGLDSGAITLPFNSYQKKYLAFHRSQIFLFKA